MPRIGEGNRGRKPTIDEETGMPKMNYYHSLKVSTVSGRDLDPTTLTTMPNERDFDFTPFSREELIMSVKQRAHIAGFRAIIPFADKNNRFYHSTAFACCLGG
jgi:hypothetical protein